MEFLSNKRVVHTIYLYLDQHTAIYTGVCDHGDDLQYLQVFYIHIRNVL